MKKIIILLACLILFTIFAVTQISTPSDILYFLNWGEYIDRDLVAEFEEKYHCQVIEEDVTSSELMYQKIKAGTTSYDVAVPGDYTVRQLYDENLLMEIDVHNNNYDYLTKYNSMFTNELQEIIDENFVDSKTNNVYNSYFMPYFWGAYSIIYNKQNADVEDVINNNGFKALYDRSLYKEKVNIGMYDTSRWTIASYLMSEGLNPNITSLDGKIDDDLSKDLQDTLVKAIRNANFDEWHNDNLKRETATGDLDMCFTQLGDFFDALYFMYDEGNTEINFHVSIPSNTAAFFDSMVIPTTCEHYDLANKFIDFMMNPDNAYRNAQAIGYCPTLKDVVQAYIDDANNTEEIAYYYEDVLTLKDFLEKYPFYLNPMYGKTEEELKKIKLLDPKSTKYLTTCETIINKAKN